MTPAETALCVDWCKAHARKWQVLNRSQWKYQFRGKTLVRYVDEVQLRENEIHLLLEFLSSSDCVATISLYDQSVSGTWIPIRAWLEISNKSAGSVHGVRLYHGLCTEPSSHADGPFVVEDGCAYKVSLTYHWGEADAPTVEHSTSGVSYRIANLVRDPDTNLFSYTVEKRERVQQDIAEYLISKTVYDKSKEEVHLGVRQENISSTGQMPSVGNGCIVTRKLSKNADCTSDIHNSVKEEIGVVDSVVEYSKGLHGIRTTRTDKSQQSALDSSGMVVGESRSTRKTEGGLHDNSVSLPAVEGGGVISESKAETSFDKTDGSVDNTIEKPDVEASASGGVVVSSTVRQNDDGTYDKSKTVHTEKQSVVASESVHRGLTGTTITTATRSCPDKSMESLSVGESRESQLTQGGLWNTVVRKVVRSASQLLGRTVRDALYGYSSSVRTVVGDDPGAPSVVSGGGCVREKSVSLTSDGSYEVCESETHEKNVVNASVEVRKTLSGMRRTVVERGASNPLGEAGMRLGEVRSSRKTDGGLYDNTVSVGDATGAGVLAKDTTENRFSISSSERSNTDNDTFAPPAFETGVIVRKSHSKNENGTYDESVSTVTAKYDFNENAWSDGYGSYRKGIYRNANAPIIPTVGDGLHLSLSYSKNEFGLYDGTYVISDTYGASGSKGGKVLDSKDKHGFTERYYVTGANGVGNPRYRIYTAKGVRGYTPISDYLRELNKRDQEDDTGVYLPDGQSRLNTFQIVGEDWDNGVKKVFCMWTLYNSVDDSGWKRGRPQNNQ